jgi:hypothetical protein
MKRAIILGLLAAGLLLVPIVAAQTGGGYDLTWSSIDGGGGTSAGSGYSLTGAIGQPDAGLQMSGGGYSLNGGFWVGAAPNYRVFLPLVLR